MVDSDPGTEILWFSKVFDYVFVWIFTQCGTNTQLLHVFQEDFILGYKPQKEDASVFSPGEGTAQCHKDKKSSLVFFFFF